MLIFFEKSVARTTYSYIILRVHSIYWGGGGGGVRLSIVSAKVLLRSSGSSLLYLKCKQTVRLKVG